MEVYLRKPFGVVQVASVILLNYNEMKETLIAVLMLLLSQFVFAQNTVGLITKTAEAYEGYNLVFPHNQSNVYLFDNCGQVVHQWEDESEFRPGNSVYLLDNGNLVKCKRASTSAVNDRIWAGGGGETVEIRNWENELLHSFTLNDSLYRLHHDIAPMPNGNVLMIAWALKDSLKSIAAGRNPDLMAQGEVWSEVILEWNPSLDSIVWEWHVWDHLIQDFDAIKDNFGNPSEYPQLIDLNYDEHNGHPDWLHINSIDYNPILDQIVLSVPYFNEYWIVNHNLTTDEAATEKGDLLHRWGNPKAYGAVGAQQLFFQHDVHWVNPVASFGTGDFGVLALFNNRVGEATSTGNLIATSPTEEGQYTFGQPNTFNYTYTHPENDTLAYSNSLSGMQLLPNGNALLLAGRYGFAYEVTPDNEIAWEYRIPIRAGRLVEQGTVLSRNNNITFRMERYPLDYPAFDGRDLSPKDHLELSPNEGFCGLVDVENSEAEITINVYPNPTKNRLNIQSSRVQEVMIYDVLGRKVEQLKLGIEDKIINVTDWQSGTYFLMNDRGGVLKFVVQ